MPNHVHVVLRLSPGQELAAVVHSWKSYTAKQANQILRRSGSWWGREYYDHLIRDGDELDRIIRYVKNNPIKAGLKDWVWVWGQDAPTTAGGTPALR
jgi:REP element-mobilizing transposase RayT